MIGTKIAARFSVRSHDGGSTTRSAREVGLAAVVDFDFVAAVGLIPLVGLRSSRGFSSGSSTSISWPSEST